MKKLWAWIVWVFVKRKKISLVVRSSKEVLDEVKDDITMFNELKKDGWTKKEMEAMLTELGETFDKIDLVRESLGGLL